MGLRPSPAISSPETWAAASVCRAEPLATLVQGNFIGTDPLGTRSIENLGDGINLAWLALDNTIGGTAAGSENVISGNYGNGISFGNLADTNIVLGNLIGTNATGLKGLPNLGNGIDVTLGFANTIGGSAPGAGNVISGNGGTGIRFTITGDNNEVLGNLIGTDISGRSGVPNGGDGVDIAGAEQDTIGGTTSGARNVISGNVGSGISVSIRATNNLIIGNFIGTDTSGLVALPNLGDGVDLDGVSTNTIGGARGRRWQRHLG